VAVTRKFVDSEGVNWQVYELSSDSEASEPRESSWLYFFARDDTRSLSAYPDDWSLMDWPGLDRLCQRAQPPLHRALERTERTPSLARSAGF
jgi:hypothetical protein